MGVTGTESIGMIHLGTHSSQQPSPLPWRPEKKCPLWFPEVPVGLQMSFFQHGREASLLPLMSPLSPHSRNEQWSGLHQSQAMPFQLLGRERWLLTQRPASQWEFHLFLWWLKHWGVGMKSGPYNHCHRSLAGSTPGNSTIRLYTTPVPAPCRLSLEGKCRMWISRAPLHPSPVDGQG